MSPSIIIIITGAVPCFQHGNDKCAVLHELAVVLCFGMTINVMVGA